MRGPRAGDSFCDPGRWHEHCRGVVVDSPHTAPGDVAGINILEQHPLLSGQLRVGGLSLWSAAYGSGRKQRRRHSMGCAGCTASGYE